MAWSSTSKYGRGARITDGFSIAIQIRCKLRFTLTSILIQWSLQILLRSQRQQRINSKPKCPSNLNCGQKSKVKRGPDCGVGCEVSCGGHHQHRVKITAGTAVERWVYDLHETMVYLVHYMSSSKLYVRFGHFGWISISFNIILIDVGHAMKSHLFR